MKKIDKKIIVEEKEEIKTTGNTANDLVHPEENDSEEKAENTFKDSINEMGKLLFERYPKKTSNLSQDNINGIMMVEVLNEYVNTNFGYRISALDVLAEQKLILVVSEKGLGINSLIEFLKSIQASFEQTQIPDRLKGLLKP
jgi:hypothetical protein